MTRRRPPPPVPRPAPVPAATTSERSAAWRRGWRAETAAALALRLKGYRILVRRFRGPGGEIDLVARRGTVLAIVEVKSRADRGAALAAVTPRQRTRVERAARAVLAALPDQAWAARATIRFDVVLVQPWRWPRHLPNAWQSTTPAGV